MKRIIIVVISVLVLWLAYVLLFQKSSNEFEPHLTISPVEYAPFTEYIPQTGIVECSSNLSNPCSVKVFIDQLYLPRIVVGLKASAKIDTSSFNLEIVSVDPIIENGRFLVAMKFHSEGTMKGSDGKSVRMRLELSGPSNAMLIPIGGFYMDTQGAWVYTVENGTTAVKRNIKLGRKNTEYFEVLEGLTEGDQVITSSYKKFNNRETFEIAELL